MCTNGPISRFYHVNTFAELYAALTGIATSGSELMKIGERCWNLYKALNIRAGFGREDDQPPKILFTPLKGLKGEEYPLIDYHQSKVLTQEDVGRAIDDYYDERGWDKGTGIPTPAKLKELALEGYL
jgi:aldehyde:ferredoxin oxidoreductase